MWYDVEDASRLAGGSWQRVSELGGKTQMDFDSKGG